MHNYWTTQFNTHFGIGRNGVPFLNQVFPLVPCATSLLEEVIKYSPSFREHIALKNSDVQFNL